MDRLTALLAPLTALLSGVGIAEAPQEREAVEAEAQLVSAPVVADDGAVFTPISDSFRIPTENQVRIEQRITIRIAPRGSAPAPNFVDLPSRLPPRLAERHGERCLPINGIAGVQVSRDNRLLLFMRDRRVIGLGLEKACRATDFYSGFYVERSADGRICVDRDRLQSRSGANCALKRMRQLIEE